METTEEYLLQRHLQDIFPSLCLGGYFGFAEACRGTCEHTPAAAVWLRSVAFRSGWKQIFAVGRLRGGNVKNEEVLCLWKGLQALKQVGWPRSLCTLPVFLCSFTLNLKTEKWNPLCDCWGLTHIHSRESAPAAAHTCRLLHVYITVNNSREHHSLFIHVLDFTIRHILFYSCFINIILLLITLNP